MQQKYSTNNKTLIGLFLVWPVLGFVVACTDVSKSLNRTIILLFFGLYGLFVTINLEMDGARRASIFEEISQKPFADFSTIFEVSMAEGSDFVEPLLMFFVSRISDFHGVLFSVYALIFGSFFLVFLKKIARFHYEQPSINSLFFLFILAWVNPIFNINGFRMWTAAWVFSLGVLLYIINKKKHYILVAGLSVFIHFTFIPIFFLFCLYTIIGNRTFAYGIAAIITFFIAELDIAAVKQYATYLGPAFEEKITVYSSEGHIEDVNQNQQNMVWYIQLGPKIFFFFLNICLLFVYKKSKGFFENKVLESLYSITLLFLTFSNIAVLLPSGGRFRTVFYIFASAALLIYYTQEGFSKKLHKINLFGLPIVAFVILITFRIGSDTISPYLLGPSITMIGGFYDVTSLKDILF
jgi:hypothetical protein